MPGLLPLLAASVLIKAAAADDAAAISNRCAQLLCVETRSATRSHFNHELHGKCDVIIINHSSL
jgi:hypothetical protein